MSRRLVNLTLDTLADLPVPCRECVFWELDPAAAKEACANGDPTLEKEAWLSQTLLEWGSCGKLIYVDDTAVGFVIYAPPAYLPGSGSFPTSPASPDAALLTTAYVERAHAGGGLGRMLVQGAARDLTSRGLRAIEAFGDAMYGEPDPITGAGDRCLAPAEFYTAVGFKTIRPHPRYPRLRLELRNALSWKEDVEYALQELFDTITPGRVGAWGVARPAIRGVAPSLTPRPVAGQVSAAARAARSVETSIEPVGTSDSIG